MDLKFHEIKDIILYNLYDYYKSSRDNVSISKDKIIKLVSDHCSPSFCSSALRDLSNSEYLTWYINSDVYDINSDGIRFVEEKLDDSNSFIHKFAYGNQETNSSIVPGANEGPSDVWEPLPIDRSTPEYDFAVSESENALKIIETDNGYAANVPDERNQVVWSLREGLTTLKEGMPSRSQIISMIVEPLKFIASKFSAAAMGEAAKAAVKAFATWLGSV